MLYNIDTMNKAITADDLRNLLSGFTHLSFSAVRDFLDDPRNFRKRWIDHDHDEKKGLPLVEGSAFHAGLETFWNCKKNGVEDFADAVRESIAKSVDMDFPNMEKTRKRIAKKDTEQFQATGCDIEIDQDKNGRDIVYAVLTADQIKSGVIGWFDGYLQDVPEYAPLLVEMAHVAPIVDVESGGFHALPLKARVDLIAEKTDTKTLHIIDHKLNSTEPDEDEDGNPIATPAMFLQALSYDSIIDSMLAAYGITDRKIESVIFDVFSKSQKRRVSVEVKLTDADRLLWSRLYKGVTVKLALAFAYEDPTTAFLPNPFGMWQTNGWDEFRKDVSYAAEVGKERETMKEKDADIEAYEL